MRALMLFGLLLGTATTLQAFSGFTHQQITKSAFRYLEQRKPRSDAASKWLKIGDKKRAGRPINELERLLSRSIVEVDYQADLWMSAWYHVPFAGGKTDYLGMLTSLYHFTNVTRPGLYWVHDGYAYRNTDGMGNDAYLGLSGMKIRGDLSAPLGGKAPAHVLGANVQQASFQEDFKGSDEDWRKMFGPSSRAADAVLPPSYVPAQLGYNEMMASARAQLDHVERWQGLLPVADGYIFMLEFNHSYWREELDGLPKALDKLGITMHMAQDLAVPHHAQGIAGYCHPEFESMVERHACSGDKNFDFLGFETGDFDQPLGNECQRLYNASQVEAQLAEWPALSMNKSMTIAERLIETGKISARTRWGKMSDQPLGVLLPNKHTVVAQDCKGILNDPEVVQLAQFQYNLGVAVTVVLFELAAQQYEALQPLASTESMAR